MTDWDSLLQQAVACSAEAEASKKSAKEACKRETDMAARDAAVNARQWLADALNCFETHKKFPAELGYCLPQALSADDFIKFMEVFQKSPLVEQCCLTARCTSEDCERAVRWLSYPFELPLSPYRAWHARRCSRHDSASAFDGTAERVWRVGGNH